MDHLPLPRNPTSWTAKVPYLCKEPYDGGDFLTYPDRAGPLWRDLVSGLENNLHRGGSWPEEIVRSVADLELESFLQRWLFFGLLQETLAPFGLYDENEYHSHNGEGEVLHMRHLMARLVSCLHEINSLPGRRRQARRSRLVQCLQISCEIFYALQLDVVRLSTERFRNLLQVFAALGSVVSAAGELAITGLPEVTWPTFVPLPLLNHPHPNEREHLRNYNWCPRLIALEGTGLNLSVEFRHYVLNTARPPTRLDHSRCTETVCETEHVDDDSYKPLHAEENCRCELIGPKLEHVAICLDSGTFPVIEIEGDNLEELVVTVRPYTKGVAYVALSHIWADGLGNPNATTLQRCQLLRLKQLIQDLAHKHSSSHRLYLWCDTLLCPIQIPYRSEDMAENEQALFRQQSQVARSRQLKQQALAKMSLVYRKATFVLVFDEELQNVAFSEMDALEAGFRIVSSRWMLRLWTFQEAVLAVRLLFQFADQAIAFGDLISALSSDMYNTPLLRRLRYSLFHRLSAIDSSILIKTGGAPSFTALCKAVRNRQGKYPEDEPLVLAAVLALDPGPVAREDILEGRMNAFWKLFGTRSGLIPSDICFNQFQRIEKPGFRWVPLTLRGGAVDALETDINEPRFAELTHLDC